MQVHIYSKTGCDYCQKAKEWFRSNQIEYDETVLDDQNERMDFYQKISNGKEINSVPQIFIDEKHIGSYTDLISQEDLILKKAFGGLETS